MVKPLLRGLNKPPKTLDEKNIQKTQNTIMATMLLTFLYRSADISLKTEKGNVK